ncbi:MAG TPA: sterol desaturase family protein [Caulobacteraceae bacterium]
MEKLLNKIGHVNPVHILISASGFVIFLIFALLRYSLNCRDRSERMSAIGYVSYTFPFKKWISISNRIDIFFYAVNKVTGHIVFITNMALAFFLAKLITYGLSKTVGASWDMHPGWVGLSLAYVLAFVPRDFLRFASHWMQHKVPFLWEFHKVHHSAQWLTPLTTERSHPVEDQIDTGAEGLALGITFGILRHFYNFSDAEVIFIAVNSWWVGHLILLGPLQHSHIPISFGIFDRIFFSPSMHHVHHSSEERHWDKNFGNCISIWDRLFGTFYEPIPGESLTLGLDNAEHHQYETIIGCYVLPFQKVWRRTKPFVTEPA